MSWLTNPLTLTLLFLGVSAALYIALRSRPGRIAPHPYPDFETQFVEVQGWRIRYHTSGQGPSILLLHGIGANLLCWRLITPLLARHFKVYALDLPGFGQSQSRALEHYGLDEQVQRLVDFMDQMQIQKSFVVGNSMGGNLALWLALTHPDRVLGCAVIAPATHRKLIPFALHKLTWLSSALTVLVTRSAMRWAHLRTVSNKDRIDRARVEETFRTYGWSQERVRSFLLATEAIRDSRLPHKLRKIPGKVLVLWGSEDRMVSRQVIDDLTQALASSEIHVHIGGGHHLQEDEPEWVSTKITDFFTDKQD